MDPNNPSNLDPKLREAYERIMGGPAPQSPNPQNPSQPQMQNPNMQNPGQAPAPQMQTEQVLETQPTLTPPPLPQDELPQSPLSIGSSFANPNPTAFEVSQGDSPVAPKKKNSFMPILLIVGCLVFFVVYAVIWSKVFGLF